jgi:RimJ/RimL family protein N-acetyltransferase
MDFKLRPFTITDLTSLVKYANNEHISDNLTDAFPYPYTEEDGRRFITMATSRDPIHVMCIEIGGEAAGGIGIHVQQDIYRKNAEMGYWVAEPFWGNRIISRAIPEMVKYGFEKFDIERIYARPYPQNTASIRALESSGFKLEAHLEKVLFKKGKYLDELIYAIRR